MQKQCLKTVLLVSLLFIINCFSIPKNRAEYRQRTLENKERYIHHSYLINSAWDDVVTNLKAKTDECLNQTVIRKVEMPGGIYDLKVNFYPEIEKISGNQADLTIWGKTRKPLDKDLKNGIYYLIADISKVDSNQTSLEIYGPSLAEDIFTALKLWSSGIDAECPGIK